jgi:hypothetical protein
MKITTSRLIIASVLLVALSNGENVRSSVQKGGEIRAQQSSFNERIRENRTLARNAEKLSKVALDRYRNNCIFVRTDGNEDHFREGVVVMSNSWGASPMRSGAFVCNQLGDTAVVGSEGRMEDIARVTTADQEELKKLLQQR